jgi:hypothetical protein
MATLTIYPNLSPRIIEVDSPTVNISVQEIVNLVRDWEATVKNLDYAFLIDAAGKEDLGGGVSVGITATLKNAIIAFAIQGGVDSSGTVTTPDATGVVLTDSAGTFISDGIVAGDTVVNVSDGSITSVLRVDSETQLTTFGLASGTDNQFDSADSYKIWNKVQCEVSGGNLVAVDENGATMSAFLPTAQTHVIRTSSSSATATSQASLEFATYDGSICWDYISGKESITDINTDGNRANPLKNLDDVISQANLKGFNTISVIDNATIGATDVVDSFVFVGVSPVLIELTFIAGCSTIRTVLRNIEVTGDIEGALEIKECYVHSFTDVGSTVSETRFVDCILEADAVYTIKLSSSATKLIQFIDCSSGSAGSTPVIIDINGASADIVMRRYAGSVLFKNITSATQKISIDTTGGHITLDSSCTDVGEFVYRGDTKMTNNSSLTVIDQTTGSVVWADSKALTIAKFLGLK